MDYEKMPRKTGAAADSRKRGSCFAMTEIKIDQGSYDPDRFRQTVDVDLVLCMDATASMAPRMRLTKDNALRLPEEIISEAVTQGKKVGRVRVKVIAFRDYRTDGAYAMQLTDFFEYPSEKEALGGLMAEIYAAGGGEEPENGLEALAYAMDSDWQAVVPGHERRQIIAVWTDGAAHPLGVGRDCVYYDPNLPKRFEELTALWNERMDHDARRMVLFAPRVKPWTTLEGCWENVTLCPSNAGCELTRAQWYEMVFRMVQNG